MPKGDGAHGRDVVLRTVFEGRSRASKRKAGAAEEFRPVLPGYARGEDADIGLGGDVPRNFRQGLPLGWPKRDMQRRPGG